MDGLAKELGLGLLVAMLVTMAMLPLLINYGSRARALAVPGGRKLHGRMVPQVGGIGIFVGFCAALVVHLDSPVQFWDASAWGFLTGAALVFWIGVVDDHQELGYRVKLGVQLLGATIGVIPLVLLMDPIQDPQTQIVLIAMGVVFIVAVTNAVNLADGLDGLAGGVVLLSSLALMILMLGNGWTTASTTYALPLFLLVVLCGSLFGFLRFNDHPAVIFMGDCGAYFLGMTLAFAALYASFAADFSLLASITFLLGIPVYDVGSVVVRRLYARQSPFAPDNRHIHHRLLQSGLTHEQAVVVVYGLHLLFILAGLALTESSLFVHIVCYTALVVLVEATHGWVFRLAFEAFRTRNAGPWVHGARSDQFGLALLVALPLVSIWRCDRVEADLMISSVGLLGVAALAALSTREFPLWLTRILLYVLGACTVFLAASGSPEAALLPWLEPALFASLGLWIVYRVCVCRRSLRFTPLDMLLIPAVLAVAQIEDLQAHMALVVVEVMIWFYAVEMLIGEKRHSRLPLAIAVLGLALIPVAGTYYALV